MRSTSVLAENVARIGQEHSEIRARLNDIQGAPSSTDDLYELGALQARYDSAFKGLEMPGAPGPLTAESPWSYRRRLLSDLKPLSPRWKDLDPYNRHLSDTVIGAAEEEVLADVKRLTDNPTQGSFREPGRLRGITTVDNGGHRVTEYRGDNAEWMSQFAGEYGVGRLNDPRRVVRRY